MSGTNNFLLFADQASNLESQSNYVSDNDRLYGNKSGNDPIARSSLMNKVLRQTSKISTVVAQFIVDYANVTASDTDSVSTLETEFVAGINAVARANNLSQFAATTSSQLASVISDETGSGSLVFSTSPTLVTPSIGVATGTSFNSITGLSSITPSMDGTATIGTSTTVARADHIHPTDTSRAPIASPTFTGTVSGITATMVGLGNVTNVAQLPNSQTLAITGDITASATALNTGTIATTLANSGVTAGTYNNSATAVTPITVDAKGRVTGTGSAVTITPAFNSLTSKPTTLSGYGITDAYTQAQVNTLASNYYTQAQINSLASNYALLAGATFTGTVTAPTFSGALTGNASTATTATNIAGGSNGTIPYQTASGTTAQLAVGTSGQVLTSNGAGAPSWTTLTGATLSGNNTFTGTNNFTTPPQIGGNNLTPFSGFKNYIINGNFDIWQYGASQTSSGYGSDDRWTNGNTGSTKTHSQVACTDTERALFSASKFSRTVVSSVAGAGNFVVKGQSIEDVTKLSGKTVTLSFWAKADSNKNIAVEFEQQFGSGGTPSAPVLGIASQLISLTTTWQKKTITATIPSIVGKTLGTNGVYTSFTSIFFGFDIGSTNSSNYGGLGQQSGTFDIAQVQLEEGSVATPFEQRPIGLELGLCQRYAYIADNSAYASGSYNSVNNALLHVKFPVTMRVVPTVTYLGGTFRFTDDYSSDWTLTPSSVTSGGLTAQGGRTIFTGLTGPIVGKFLSIYPTGVETGKVLYSAEL